MTAPLSFKKDFSLKEKCYMRVGGKAKYACFPKDTDQLTEAVRYCREENIRYIIIGNASNTVFTDGGFDGCVIFTGELVQISTQGCRITASCGVSLNQLSRTALEKGLSGLEFAYGIPGTVGGGIYMNAGAYGGQLSDVFEKAVCLDSNGNTVEVTKEDMRLGYRTSALQENGYTLLYADFALKSGDRAEIKRIMDANMAARREKQPLEYPSCGSTFKRPEGHFAGALIEQCGLKGFTYGGAQVSEKHAGFIINRDNATAADVLGCIELVRQKVFEQTGVMLEPEIRIIK